MNVINKYISLCIGTAVLAAAAQSSVAAPFAVEARSLGMGNVSVATSDIATAAFANPAMLSYQSQRDDFSFLIPGVGVYLDDSDGMVDLVDRYQAGGVDGAAALNTLTTGPAEVISPQVAVATAIGFSGDTYSFAVAARSDIIAWGAVTGAPLNPDLTILGVQTTEVGVSLARNFELMERKVSVGLTPKIINVKSIAYVESLSTVDAGSTGILDNATETDHGDLSTVDAGVVMEVSESIQLGLVAKNLITDEVNIGLGTLSIDTELRAGIAYRGDFFALGADLDLSENDPAITPSSPALFALQGEKTRMLLLGAEFNAFDFAQLRVGMQKNLASGISDKAKDALLTAGVGFWFGFHLDVSVISGTDILGVFAQTGFRF